jgi:FkbM family methyltransferase
MATRTAYSPTSLRYQLRSIGALRQSVRFARRLVHLPGVIVSYVRSMGFYGLDVFVRSAWSGREVLVAMPGVSAPVRIRPGTSDKFCFEQIFLERCYDLIFPKDARLIIDAGANVGYASIFFANNYPQASILALEPEPSNFEALVTNARPYPQIKTIRAALWDKAETVVVDNSDESWAAFVTKPDSLPREPDSAMIVQGTTIGELLRISGEDKIDILKLDVEGAEKEIFAAADCSWIGKTRVLIVELHDRMLPGCSQALEKALRGYSFRRTMQGENVILTNCEAGA